LLPSVQTTNDDSVRMASAPGVRFINPGDGKAMGNYTETYSYDAVGNFLQMVHQVASGGWTTRYAYKETSGITASEVNNRLSSTSLPGDVAAGPYSAAYTYDAHGSMTSMPHLPVMQWTFLDQLRASSKQVFNGGTPETTYYVYDAAGQRVRKARCTTSRRKRAQVRRVAPACYNFNLTFSLGAIHGGPRKPAAARAGVSPRQQVRTGVSRAADYGRRLLDQGEGRLGECAGRGAKLLHPQVRFALEHQQLEAIVRLGHRALERQQPGESLHRVLVFLVLDQLPHLLHRRKRLRGIRVSGSNQPRKYDRREF